MIRYIKIGSYCFASVILIVTYSLYLHTYMKGICFNYNTVVNIQDYIMKLYASITVKEIDYLKDSSTFERTFFLLSYLFLGYFWGINSSLKQSKNDLYMSIYRYKNIRSYIYKQYKIIIVRISSYIFLTSLFLVTLLILQDVDSIARSSTYQSLNISYIIIYWCIQQLILILFLVLVTYVSYQIYLARKRLTGIMCGISIILLTVAVDMATGKCAFIRYSHENQFTTNYVFIGASFSLGIVVFKNIVKKYDLH